MTVKPQLVDTYQEPLLPAPHTFPEPIPRDIDFLLSHCVVVICSMPQRKVMAADKYVQASQTITLCNKNVGRCAQGRFIDQYHVGNQMILLK